MKQPIPQRLKTKAFKTLYAALNAQNARTLLVGGCVRDLLQGKDLGDIDLATTLLPDDAAKRLKAAGFHIVPIGLSHGTILATMDGEKYEITTLREDLSTDGRHAEVGFTNDFEKDAGRRDFTFNALYMDDQGHITDYFGGADDLEKGIVRFVGAPSKRLAEDWLRALRYFRFYARLNKTTVPDAETEGALANAAAHMAHLSAERKTAELLKIMAAPHAESACELMQKLGFMEALGLEKFDLDAFKRWRQTAQPELARAGVENLGLLNLIAALWKPTRTLRLKEALCENPHFSFSNAEKQLMLKLAPYNMRHLQHKNPAYSAFKLGQGDAQLLFYLANLHSYTHKPVPAVPPAPEAVLKGEDLKKLGLTDGKTLGSALNTLNRWAAWHGVNNKAEVLKQYNAQHTPNVLIVPDIHGNIGAFKGLLESEFGQQASVIASLGDYLDASEEDPKKTRIIDTAEFVFDLLETDPRFIMLRANHEQINARMMRRALMDNTTPATFMTPNKHNLLLLQELEKLSKERQLAFMAKQLDTYVQKSADGLRLQLASGEILGFTHGGWHVDIEDPHAAVDTLPLGPHKLEVLTFNIFKMPKHARYEALWGHWLAVPEELGRQDTAHLNLPPEGYTLVVGHHFTRRKNTQPEKTGNIIFADTGSGKGGQLTALRITPATSLIEAIIPDQKGGFKATPLHTTPHVVPFVRRIPASDGSKSA